MKLLKNMETQVATTRNLKKTNKEGRIQKKDGNILIEMKNYKMNELTALQNKYAKVDVELSVDDEKILWSYNYDQYEHYVV